MDCQISIKCKLAFIFHIILLLISYSDGLDSKENQDENITTIKDGNNNELEPLGEQEPKDESRPFNGSEGLQKTDEKPDFEGRIHGGNFVGVDDYPYVMYLVGRCKGGHWMCGSSIVNQKLVITAAHCVHGCTKKFQIDLYAGSANIDKVNTMRRTHRYIIHENYNDDTMEADLALLHLNNDLPLGKLISRVIIRPSFGTNREGIVAGWGSINVFHQPSHNLKGIRQYIQPSSKCSHIEMLPGMMCAYSGLEEQHPAEGDSGSGFVTADHQIIGVVSFSGRSHLDIIFYTNVSYYYDWVKDYSVRLACAKSSSL